jgi:AcrR family transcriptional regulator
MPAMPARADPTVRRRQLIEAASELLAERGSEGTRLSDVAERLGVATSLVSYYFPSRDDLILEATRFGVEHSFIEEAAELARIEDPLERLEHAIHWTIPDGPRDPIWTITIDLWLRAMRRPPLRTVAAMFQSRARTLFASIIETGRSTGRFSPVASTDSISASVVAMIDGLAMRIVLLDPSITAADMEALVVEYARLAVGADPPGGQP